MKAMTPLGPVVGKVMNQGPNLRELISSADNVTFWAKHDKAMAELGYSPRGLEQGLRDTLEAEGKLPAGAAGLAALGGPQWLSTACRPIAPITIRQMHMIRSAPAGSPSARIPTVAVPAAPMPVHTA